MTQTINIINGGEVTIDIKDITMFNYVGGQDNIIVGNNSYLITPNTSNRLKMLAAGEENQKTYYGLDKQDNLKGYYGSYLFIDKDGNRMLQLSQSRGIISADYNTLGTSEDLNDVYEVLKSKIAKIKYKDQNRIAHWNKSKELLTNIPEAPKLDDYTFTINGETYKGGDMEHIVKKLTYYAITVNQKTIKAPKKSKIAMDITSWINNTNNKPLWFTTDRPQQTFYSFFSGGIYYQVHYNNVGNILISYHRRGGSHDKLASKRVGIDGFDILIEEVFSEHRILDRKLDIIKKHITAT